jgi:hypothetical protein
MDLMTEYVELPADWRKQIGSADYCSPSIAAVRGMVELIESWRSGSSPEGGEPTPTCECLTTNSEHYPYCLNAPLTDPALDKIGTARKLGNSVFVKLAEPESEPWHVAFSMGPQNVSGWQSNEDLVDSPVVGYVPFVECGTPEVPRSPNLGAGDSEETASGDLGFSTEPAIGGNVRVDTSAWPADFTNVWLEVYSYSQRDTKADAVLDPSEAREIAAYLVRAADHADLRRSTQDSGPAEAALCGANFGDGPVVRVCMLLRNHASDEHDDGQTPAPSVGGDSPSPTLEELTMSTEDRVRQVLESFYVADSVKPDGWFDQLTAALVRTVVINQSVAGGSTDTAAVRVFRYAPPSGLEFLLYPDGYVVRRYQGFERPWPEANAAFLEGEVQRKAMIEYSDGGLVGSVKPGDTVIVGNNKDGWSGPFVVERDGTYPGISSVRQGDWLVRVVPARPSGVGEVATPPTTKCICPKFVDTGGFGIADLCCPIHGVDGSDPGDGFTYDEADPPAAVQPGEVATP